MLENKSYKYPVSIKGIIPYNEKLLLLKNERNEWELPGGKLELNEEPKECLKREIFEEVNVEVKIKNIINSWIYRVFDDVHVLIITYGCYEIKNGKFMISNEHSEGKWFGIQEIEDINMPKGYKESIYTWFNNDK